MHFEPVNESSKYLLERTKYRPKIAVICGSGLGESTIFIPGQYVFSFLFDSKSIGEQSLGPSSIGKLGFTWISIWGLQEYSSNICCIEVCESRAL